MSPKDKKVVQVNSEVGRLRRLLVHSPDSGLGKVVPSKAQDWLFEDIVHLETMRKKEYDYYTKVLLYFLDPEKIRGRLHQIDAPENNRDFYKPEKSEFYKSEKVVELEWLLADVLKDQETHVQYCTCRIWGEAQSSMPKSGPQRQFAAIDAPGPHT